jgi:hypothetical protein
MPQVVANATKRAFSCRATEAEESRGLLIPCCLQGQAGA